MMLTLGWIIYLCGMVLGVIALVLLYHHIEGRDRRLRKMAHDHLQDVASELRNIAKKL